MCQTRPLNPGLGTLSKFPPEIIFKILDDMLYSEPRLTHKTLCTICQLTKTNKTLETLIKYQWIGQKAYTYIKDSVNAIEWHLDSDYAYDFLTRRGVDQQTIMPITGPADLGPDLLTSIIFDDCVDCFEWFASALPPTLMNCCNEGGWTFLSLALHARSGKLLYRFFSAGYPFEPSDFIAGYANALEIGPSNIGVAASSKDHVSFARMWRKLKEVLNGRGFQRTVRARISRQELAAIKSVAPPYLQKMLYEAGLTVLHPRSRYSPYYDGRRNR
ncbi:uncharacterized protein N7515_001699 [Penicillium bovifimosum]|uniref:Uncharacterized protein n=1 Tax=Penicillium bovifimosum TaxID=126998 RepID=A0A9W9HA63_9EURO|nr:uncharacterized protein N7515_001699 [Penicillium bovifimosum]KAJ5142912.1 hypothetical protein N7515_001699 [Penicillium bovifimosum]